MRSNHRTVVRAAAVLAAVLSISVAAPAQQEATPVQKAQAPVSTGWTAGPVDPDHEVAKAVREAIASGELFDVSFHLFDEERLSQAQLASLKQQAAMLLTSARSVFPARPRIVFHEGADFRLTATEKKVTFPYRMKSDYQQHPSSFSLLARQKRQVYLVFVGKDNYGDLQKLHLLMWKVGGKWRAVHFTMIPARMGGLDFDKAFAAARTEETADRNLLAVALYGSAVRMAGRLPYRTPGAFNRALGPLTALTAKLGFPDKPIDVIVTSDGKLAITRCDAISRKGRLHLFLERRLGAAELPAEVASRQKRIATACLKKYPDLKAYFKAITVTSSAPAEGGRTAPLVSSFLIEDLEKRGAADRLLQRRMNVVTASGKPVTLLGPDLAVGSEAPEFRVLGGQSKEVKLSDFRGKTVVISVVPGVATRVCTEQVVRFNKEAAKLGADVVVLTISQDPPDVLARFVAAHNIHNTAVLSDRQRREFGRQFGLQVMDRHLLARAVLVISPEGKVAYREIVPEMTRHPDYEKALQAVKYRRSAGK